MKRSDKALLLTVPAFLALWLTTFFTIDNIPSFSEQQKSKTSLVRMIEHPDKAVIVMGQGDPTFYSEEGRKKTLYSSSQLYEFFSSQLGTKNVAFFVPEQVEGEVQSGIRLAGPETSQNINETIRKFSKNSRNLYVVLMETPRKKLDALYRDVGNNPWINLNSGKKWSPNDDYGTSDLLPLIRDGNQSATILIENIADYGAFLNGLSGVSFTQLGPFIKINGFGSFPGTGSPRTIYEGYSPLFLNGEPVNKDYNGIAPRNLFAFAVNPYFGQGFMERYKRSPKMPLQKLIEPNLVSSLYLDKEGNIKPMDSHLRPLFQQQPGKVRVQNL